MNANMYRDYRDTKISISWHHYCQYCLFKQTRSSLFLNAFTSDRKLLISFNWCWSLFFEVPINAYTSHLIPVNSEQIKNSWELWIYSFPYLKGILVKRKSISMMYISMLVSTITYICIRVVIICDWILENQSKLHIRCFEMNGFKNLKPLEFAKEANTRDSSIYQTTPTTFGCFKSFPPNKI